MMLCNLDILLLELLLLVFLQISTRKGFPLLTDVGTMTKLTCYGINENGNNIYLVFTVQLSAQILLYFWSIA